MVFLLIDNNSWENIPDAEKKKWGLSINTNDTQIETEVIDRFTRQFRIREVKTTIQSEDGNKTYEDRYITHLLDEDEWKEELSRGGFESFNTYHDYEEGKKTVRIGL